MNLFDKIFFILMGMVDGFILAFVLMRFWKKEAERQDEFNKENQHLTPQERIARFKHCIEERRN